MYSLCRSAVLAHTHHQQVDAEADKTRLLCREAMPLAVGHGHGQLQLLRYYSAGGLFRHFELAHAAVPGAAVTVFSAKQVVGWLGSVGWVGGWLGLVGWLVGCLLGLGGG